MRSIKFHAFLNIFLSLTLVIGILPSLTFAQDGGACSEETTGKSQAQLQADLDACTKEIQQWTDILNNTKSTSASYERDIAALTAKINAAQASIKAKNIAIANLSKNITAKTKAIDDLNTRLEKGKETLSALLRKTGQIDSFTIAEAMLSNKDLSEFFVDVDTYSVTERSLNDVFDEIRGIKAQTEEEKANLDKQRAAEADAKAAIEAAKAEVEKSKAEKNSLLADSKSKEKTYASVLAERQAKAAQIRSILFNLRDSAAIPFGTALQYAQAASAATGVRPAFLLAILTQESNLGANVGTCYLTNTLTGDGISVNGGTPKPRVMSPTRDVPVFLDILQNVGGEVSNTRVSCWQPIYSSSGAPIGWGGAMGPAQFIPSTWKLFTSRIATMTGNSYPNPWNARDAFFASAIYLGDLGASSGTATAEKNAACRYYSGSTCKTSYANSYGNSVLAKATTIQTTMIDPLQGL
ncbi:lytic murein transglycosylase [Candidatus Parcubacteria bacterium]|nr:lytic murein transglycosylase [Candidatus Parcubacteria bacterium]